MKKSVRSIVAALLLMSVIPTQMYASTPAIEANTITMNTVETDVLLKRLDEINAMDKSKLTSPEKKQLRKEVRSIQKQMGSGNGGIYISVGALIIIILLLIILL